MNFAKYIETSGDMVDDYTEKVSTFIDSSTINIMFANESALDDLYNGDISYNDYYMLESDNNSSWINKIQDGFMKIFNKVKEFIEETIEKIQITYIKHTAKHSVKKLYETLKKNPELSNEAVEVFIIGKPYTVSAYSADAIKNLNKAWRKFEGIGRWDDDDFIQYNNDIAFQIESINNKRSNLACKIGINPNLSNTIRTTRQLVKIRKLVDTMNECIQYFEDGEPIKDIQNTKIGIRNAIDTGAVVLSNMAKASARAASNLAAEASRRQRNNNNYYDESTDDEDDNDSPKPNVVQETINRIIQSGKLALDIIKAKVTSFASWISNTVSIIFSNIKTIMNHSDKDKDKDDEEWTKIESVDSQYDYDNYNDSYYEAYNESTDDMLADIFSDVARQSYGY